MQVENNDLKIVMVAFWKALITWKPIVTTFGQKWAHYDEETPTQRQLICEYGKKIKGFRKQVKGVSKHTQK